jgi:hypothetical protein
MDSTLSVSKVIKSMAPNIKTDKPELHEMDLKFSIRNRK